MAAEEPGVESQDCEAIDAYEAALDAFAERLNLLHISGGSPSYSTVAAASVRPRLTTTGLNEMLSGKRLPSLETLLEYLRVVTTPSGLDKPAAAKFRAAAELVEEWRGHWQDAKLLQRRAQAANKRVRATVRQVHDDAVRDAEALRTAARSEAERIRTSAHTDAENIPGPPRRRRAPRPVPRDDDRHDAGQHRTPTSRTRRRRLASGPGCDRVTPSGRGDGGRSRGGSHDPGERLF
ncbi:hypothetical protein [Streptomyces virginiae]|uniref:hypothetical protein n=1 Tax=Streptomyces virginiae TaxID=1961 RepID=UPI0037B4F23A